MSSYYYGPLTQKEPCVASIHAIVETPAIMRSGLNFRLDEVCQLYDRFRVTPDPEGLVMPAFHAMDAEFGTVKPVAVYMCHEDENDDGITESVVVYSRDYSEPLPGDYRGVELCRIRYIPCRQDSVLRAVSIAKAVIATSR